MYLLSLFGLTRVLKQQADGTKRQTLINSVFCIQKTESVFVLDCIYRYGQIKTSSETGGDRERREHHQAGTCVSWWPSCHCWELRCVCVHNRTANRPIRDERPGMKPIKEEPGRRPFTPQTGTSLGLGPRRIRSMIPQWVEETQTYTVTLLGLLEKEYVTGKWWHLNPSCGWNGGTLVLTENHDCKK